MEMLATGSASLKSCSHNTAYNILFGPTMFGSLPEALDFARKQRINLLIKLKPALNQIVFHFIEGSFIGVQGHQVQLKQEFSHRAQSRL